MSQSLVHTTVQSVLSRVLTELGVADGRLDAVAQRLGQAMPQLSAVLAAVAAQLPELDGARVRAAVERAWHEVVHLPTARQFAEVRAFVARVLEQSLSVSAAESARLALELTHDPDDADDAAARAQSPLSPLEWQRVREAVVGIDLTYRRELADAAAWARGVRVFYRDDAGRLKQVAQDTTVAWSDLPTEVRDACTDAAGHDVHQFILYPAPRA